MLSFTRRLKSSLVKAQASDVLTNVIEEKKQYYDIAEYQTGYLKELFDQKGLIIPVETIIEKYKSEDYDFFLNRGNFLKVADTLEKFGSNLDMDHAEAKNFVLFKKKLYKLYEVRARSALEHSEFSSTIREDELIHVYDAHKHHLAFVNRDTFMERVSNQANLKGAYFKRKLLSPSRLKGMTSGAVALSFYFYNPYLWPYFASNIILAKLFNVVPIAAALHSIYNFSERDIVHSIERIDSGSDAGKIKISIAVSPFVTKDIIANVEDIFNGGNVGKTGFSALKVNKGYDCNTKESFNKMRIYALDTSSDGNAWIDREGIDWLLEEKDSNSQTDKLYADLIHHRAKKASNTKRERKDILQEIIYAVER
jgi:hypothetical protein